MVKNPPANAGDAGDMGSIPGPRRSPGGGNGKPYCIFAWKIPWPEAPKFLAHRIPMSLITLEIQTLLLSLFTVKIILKYV